jgi:hypothetical protein
MRSHVDADDDISSIGSLVSALTAAPRTGVNLEGKSRRISGLYLQYDAEFAKICSLCRHNRVKEAEAALSEPDWILGIDYQDDGGNSLLHIAAQNGNKRMVNMCLRHGANINLQNGSGQTPLHFALRYNYR